MKLLHLFSIISLLSEPTQEEYSLYSKALTAIYTSYFTPPLGSKIMVKPLDNYQFFVINNSINKVTGLTYDGKDTTNIRLFSFFLRDTLNLKKDEKWLTLLEDFGKRKLLNITFKESFNTPFKTELISFRQFPKSKKARIFWKKYYKKYPNSGGFIQLSEIVYSPERDRAVFYYERFSNPLNAVGEVVFMRKHNNEWYFVYVGELWIS